MALKFLLLFSLLAAVAVLAAAQRRRGRSLRRRPFGNFRALNRRRFSPTRVARKCRKNINERTYSGFCNNVGKPKWGSTHTTFLRKSPYAAPKANLPNPRVVSNNICRETVPKKNKRGLSELVTFFGQFIDHTITETENTATAWDIPIPANDPVFTAGGTIPFFRTATEPRGKHPSPVNLLSSYVDATSVYGTNEDDANALREGTGGKMALDASGLLTVDSGGFFQSGDKRANENPLLTTLHTIWTREHNRVAAEVVTAFPKMGDEEVYQLARLITSSELQAVTWYEFLPAVLGGKLGPYRGYKMNVNAGISREFSTVGFRVGHTMINGKVTSINAAGVALKQNLRNMFFNPGAFASVGVDNYLRGMTRVAAAEIDAGITEDVRDFLFSNSPGATVQLDLAALNVQRGRDHGIPSYNKLRKKYGLAPAATFADITSNTALQSALQTTYTKVGLVEGWIGGISEDHRKGSLGPLFSAIWRKEFARLRNGDRFYFERPGLFTKKQINKIPTLKALVGTRKAIGKVMRKVIIKNSGLKPGDVSGNPFFV